MDKEHLSFGQWLQRRRQALHLTQQQLGTLAGCSVGMIRKLEADERHPSVDVARLLATALQLPTHEHEAFLRYARGEPAETSSLPAAAVAPRARPMQPPTNLPAPTTALIGRQQELVAVRALLDRHDVRLVTLTGPGGIGKTRLGLAVGEALRDAYVDGVFFVDLAPLSDPELVLPTIAQTLAVQELAGQSLLVSVQAYLRDKYLLLILDNFEQVLAAGLVVAELLRAAPHLTMVVTSRAPLHLRGEHEYAVPPLAAPTVGAHATPETLSHYDAVRLFVDRAQAVKADFQVTNAIAPAVAEVCAHLDGLPLAIELAAARVKLLPPGALLQRLQSRLKVLTGGQRDLPARQQTIRATIDWSYSLLEPAEQTLFARLAVFVGGGTLEAAEAVCSDEEPGDATRHSPRLNTPSPLLILDGLQSLVDKSLLRYEHAAGGEPYFKMFETIREYAVEQLARLGEAAQVQARHAAHFVRLAEMAEPELVGPQQAPWAQRLEQAHGDLEAALAWALEHNAAETALMLSRALARFWWMRGYLREGRHWLDQVLDRCAHCPPSIRAKALYWSGILALHQGEYRAAAWALEESLAIFQQLGERHGVGNVLNALGTLANQQLDPARARRLQAEGLAIYRELEDHERIATLLNNLGFTALLEGDLARASELLTESLTLARAQQDSQGVAFALNNLGLVALRSGAYAQADAQLRESLALFWGLGDKRNSAECLEGLAQVAATQGKGEVAARLLGNAETLREAAGAPVPPYDRERCAATVAAVRAQMDPPTFATVWAEGRAMSLEQAVAYALEQPLISR